MSISFELQKIAEKLSPFEDEENEGLDELTGVIEDVSKSFSGSWLGYHSCVYYRGFNRPPAGAVFSPEWGLMDVMSMGNMGDWVTYQYDYDIDYI